MTEKPLHVQVAEALGCKPVFTAYLDGTRYEGRDGMYACSCRHLDLPHNTNDGGCHSQELAEYDTDWSATGPLIEKYNITLQGRNNITTEKVSDGWLAFSHHTLPAEYGATPLLAICHLILALKEAGKL